MYKKLFLCLGVTMLSNSMRAMDNGEWEIVRKPSHEDLNSLNQNVEKDWVVEHVLIDEDEIFPTIADPTTPLNVPTEVQKQTIIANNNADPKNNSSTASKNITPAHVLLSHQKSTSKPAADASTNDDLENMNGMDFIKEFFAPAFAPVVELMRSVDAMLEDKNE